MSSGEAERVAIGSRPRPCADLRAPRPQPFAVAQRNGAPFDRRRFADSNRLGDMDRHRRRSRQVEASRSRQDLGPGGFARPA
jgi:hypothetical protein